MFNKIQILCRMKLWSSFYYNFISGKVTRKGKGLVLYEGAKLLLSKNAKMHVVGIMSVNADCGIRNNGRSSIIKMDGNSLLSVNGSAVLSYGSDVIVFNGGSLELSNVYFNINTTVRCKSRIHIGSGTVISRNVCISDTDGHEIIRQGYQSDQPVYIGDHVWIGMNAIILKGAVIGDGAVVAAGTVVNGYVPEHTLVGGNPMRVIRKYIEWK